MLIYSLLLGLGAVFSHCGGRGALTHARQTEGSEIVKKKILSMREKKETWTFFTVACLFNCVLKVDAQEDQKLRTGHLLCRRKTTFFLI